MHQSSKEGSYEVSEKVNEKTTWVSNSNAIWYSRKENVWFIGPLRNIGKSIGDIYVFKRRGFSCPYEATIDVIKFKNFQTNTLEPDESNDITIQCTTTPQGDKKR